MGLSAAIAVSRAGLDLERTRVEVAMRNVANAHTVAPPGQQGFVPMRVVARAVHADAGGVSSFPFPIPAGEIRPAGPTERRVLDPGHPDADAGGYVRYPAVDSVTEMMEMTRAYRAYEANVAALQTARALALKALDIGGKP